MRTNLYFWGVTGLAIVAGGVIYALAPNGMLAYSLLIDHYPFVTSILSLLKQILPEINTTGFIRFQVADLLWAFALTALLARIWHRQLGSLSAKLSIILVPQIYEFMQASGLVSGTFDWRDCLAMLLGSTLAMLFVKQLYITSYSIHLKYTQA